MSFGGKLPITPGMQAITDYLTFASEADLLMLAGIGFMAASMLALLGDKRRSRRERMDSLDRVGWVPWTAIFMACMIIGGGLLALSVPRVIAS